MSESMNKKQNFVETFYSGDENAFKAIFLNYFPRVKGFIAHLIKNEAVAEDLSQEIFVNLWELRESLPQIRSFDAYLYRMAKNAVLNHVKRNSYHERYISHEILKQEEFTIEEEVFAKEIELLVELTVSKMPEQRKRIYTMSRLEGLKNEEIAEKLNITKKTVENHLNAALKDIRKSILYFLLFFI